ncbi:MAG: Flp pilus assembly protein CpaB [Aestuariivirgaceae bacterium]
MLARSFLAPPPPERQVVEITNIATAEVLVATADLPLGDRLTASNVAWHRWPTDAITPQMISREAKPDAPAELENARLRAPVFEGEPIDERKLVLPNSAGFMAALLPKGMRAISVAITAETGAGGFILPNDRVDVLMTYNAGGDRAGQQRSLSETVLMNVRVLAIDQTFRTNDKGEQVVVGKTATLELEPRQAEVLAFAEQTGQLSLALRSIADNGERALGDDGPRLAQRYARGGRGGEIRFYRYGVRQTTSSDR